VQETGPTGTSFLGYRQYIPNLADKIVGSWIIKKSGLLGTVGDDGIVIDSRTIGSCEDKLKNSTSRHNERQEDFETLLGKEDR
jgi:hypothetical protein